jgi:hypothetical protein
LAESSRLGSSSIGPIDLSDEMVTKRGQGYLGDKVRIVGGIGTGLREAHVALLTSRERRGPCCSCAG